MSKHHDELVRQIVQIVDVPAYQYLSYSTGYFGNRYAGVDLQFIELRTGENPHATFNADLTRARTTKTGKKGDRLPKGRFRITRGRDLYKFWLRTGLPIPSRLSVWHDYMGNLRQLLFEGTVKENGRFAKETLKPLKVSSEDIKAAILPNSCQTSSKQTPDSIQTIHPDNDLAQSHAHRGFQENLATGTEKCGNKVIRENGYKADPTSPSSIAPEDQTCEEWLADYCGDDSWSGFREASDECES